jgi:hypothetical protein
MLYQISIPNLAKKKKKKRVVIIGKNTSGKYIQRPRQYGIDMNLLRWCIYLYLFSNTTSFMVERV